MAQNISRRHSAGLRHSLMTGMVIVVSLLAGEYGLSQSEQPAPTAETAPRNAARLGDLLIRGDFESAQSLLDHAPKKRQASMLAQALNSAPHTHAFPTLPDHFATLLVESLAGAQADTKRDIIRALGFFLSRESVRGLLDALENEKAGALRAEIFAALVRQTGKDDLGDDAGAWTAWWEQVEWLTEGDWRQRLLANHRARAARLGTSVVELESQLADVFRRLHASTPDNRSKIVEELLLSEMPSLRALGLNLASRALLNAEPLNDAIGRAALKSLNDSDPTNRAAAAQLLSALELPEIAAAARKSLRQETDAGSAAALLALSARWPDEQTTRAATRWLDSDDPIVREAAAAHLLSAETRGLLDDPAYRKPSLDALRRTKRGELGIAAIRLLGRIGEEKDRRAFFALLDDENSARRVAAAQSLVDWPSSIERLVAAAEKHSDILLPAVRALAQHRPQSSAAIWAMRQLSAATDEPASQDTLTGFEALVSALPPGELGALVRSVRIKEVAHRPLVTALANSQPGVLRNTPGRVGAFLELAELCLDRADPESASRALASVAGRAARDEALRFRLDFLTSAWRGSLTDQARAGADTQLWIEAVRRISPASPERAAELVHAFEEQFRAVLSEDEAAALAEVTRPLREAGLLNNPGEEKQEGEDGVD